MALATVKYVSELHAVSLQVAFQGNNDDRFTALNFRPILRRLPILFCRTLSSKPRQAL